MHGLVLLLAGADTIDPTIIATVQSGRPAGVYVSGSIFKVASPAHSISKFLGASSDAKLRFDLVPNFVRVSRVRDSNISWQRKSDDAALLGDKVHCLYNNDLITYNYKGTVESRKKLTRSAIKWTHLDLNLSYAAGFRRNPSDPGSWPLFLLDLHTLQVTQLPLTYDLGGPCDINIASSAKISVLYDDFRTYLLKDGRIYSPAWLRKLDSHYTYNAITAAGKLYLLQGKIGCRSSQVVEAETGRVIAQSSSGLNGFVLGKRDHLMFYEYDGKQVIVYAP